MTEKTELTISSIKDKLKEVGLEEIIDIDFYLKAREGGVGSAFPIAELLGADPTTKAPAYVARRDCWKEGEYVIGVPAIAYDSNAIDNFNNVPGHLRFIAKAAKMTTFVGTSFYKLSFKKDVDDKYYINLESYVPAIDDCTVNDWVLTSMTAFYSMYFSKPVKPKKDK